MLKKAVIIGPESTGKSTLAKNLADYFGCLWVPEFAREFLEKLDRPYRYDDLLDIAKGQISFENELSQKSKELLVCDTDLNVIKVWSEHRFGKVDPWIINMITKRKYDLYLLTDIDIPWQDDPQREHPQPEMREHFFEIYRSLLLDSGVPFCVISGKDDFRKSKSIDFIKKTLFE